MKEHALNFASSQQPRHPVEKKLERFRSFPPGWFYGDGNGFEESTIDRALELNSAALSAMLFEADVFPAASGELMLTLYYGDYHLELMIENDGTVSTILEQGDNELESQEGLSISDAKGEILKFRRLAWKQSDLSIRNNGTEGVVGSQVSHSKIQATTPVSQSLIASALSKVATLFASTFSTTTPLLQSTHSSSGVLIRHSYQ